MCRPTQDQLLIDWTATINNELQSPTGQLTSPDSAVVSLAADVTGPARLSLSSTLTTATDDLPWNIVS